MGRSFCSSVLFLIFCIIALSNGDFSTGAIRTVRCLLSHTQPTDCGTLPEVTIPSYLVQDLADSPSSLQDALRSGQLSHLSNAQVARLPITLLYLFPRGRLMELNGTQLGAIMGAHTDDTSLAHQVAASLQGPHQLLQIIHKLKVSSLSPSVLQILGRSITLPDLTGGFFNALPHLDTPLLAYLHPTVLLKIHIDSFYKVMLHLKELDFVNQPNKESIKVLAQAAIRHKIPLPTFGWLATGLTPDELRNESLRLNLSSNSFKLDFNFLQARAIFEKVYHNTSLTHSHAIDSKPLLFKLSPPLLQRFPPRHIKYDPQEKFSAQIPLPTALQIREYVKADCILTGKLPGDDPSEWGSRIRYLGPWVFTLPRAALTQYINEPLSTANLQAIESPSLSKLQVSFLTGKGEALDVTAPNTILGLDTLLHALPASQLNNRKVGDISSSVLEHLTANLPADNMPRTLSLVHKIASSIGEPFILKSLLDNRDVNTIISMVSPKDLLAAAPQMLKLFSNNAEYGPIVQQLPQHVLALLLEQVRLNGNWSWRNVLNSSHVSHLLVGALTCQHIREMDTGLFIPIIAQYNRMRTIFPKNLQNCCLQKLISHLKLKMSITQTDPILGLISLLEPVDIESVGGFVLVGLPVDAMRASPYLGNILSSIGKLSVAELITATNLTHLYDIAQLAVDKEGNVNVFVAGNLSWFLPKTATVPERRLMLEGGLLDTTLCLTAEARRHLAGQLIAEFGPTENWSAGVLAALQDLLIVFTNEELETIKQSSWTEAADSFTTHYSDSIEWNQSGPFYKVCAGVLGQEEGSEFTSSLARLIGWRLRAAHWLLETVQEQSHMAQVDDQVIPISHLNLERQPEMTIRIFNPHAIPDTETEHSTEINSAEESATDYSSQEESATDNSNEEESTTDNSNEEESTSDISNKEESATDSNSGEELPSSTTEEPRPSKETASEEITSETSSTSTTVKTTVKIVSTKEDGITESSDTESSSTTVISIVNNSEKDFVNSSELITTSTLIPTSTIPTTNDNSTAEGKIVTVMPQVELTNSSISSVEEKTSTTKTSLTDYSVEVKPDQSSDVHEDKINDERIDGEDKTGTGEVTQITDITESDSDKSSYDEQSSNIPEAPESTSSTTTESLQTNTLDNNPISNPLEQEKIGSITSTELPADLTTSHKELHKSSANSTKLLHDIDGSNTTKENITATEEKAVNVSSLPTSSDLNPVTENYSDIKVDNVAYIDEKENNISIITGGSTSFESVTEEKESTETNESEKIKSNENVNPNDERVEDLNNHVRRRRNTENERGFPFKLTCNVLRMVGSLSGLALTDEDVTDMDAEELKECADKFGSMELSENQIKHIWNIVQLGVKEEGARFFGNIVRSAPVSSVVWDFQLKVDEPWALEDIHYLMTYAEFPLQEKAVNRLEVVNAEYNPVMLAALGSKVCLVEDHLWKRLEVVGLAPWADCPACLPRLATLATQQLGSVDGWTQHHMHALHGIIAGLELEAWKTLVNSSYKPLAALQPTAIKCLNTSHLQVLTADHIREIPTMTLLALQDHQLSALTPEQLTVVANNTNYTISDKLTPKRVVLVAGVPSGASCHHATLVALLTVFCINIITLCSR